MKKKEKVSKIMIAKCTNSLMAVVILLSYGEYYVYVYAAPIYDPNRPMEGRTFLSVFKVKFGPF